jgi:D-sorbitol dehydrogenase (acceptor)
MLCGGTIANVIRTEGRNTRLRGLAGKTVIITGGARGIGKASAARLCEEGARCYMTDLDRTAVEQAATELTRNGGNATGLVCDMRSSADRTSAIRSVLDQAGRIDALVNSAGIIEIQPFFEVTPDAWARTFDINVTALFFMMQEVARTMVDREVKGRIVNIASEAGRRGSESCAHYGASKAAVISLTRTAALALAPHGIAVNAVAPGLTQTDMWDRIDAQFTQSGRLAAGEIKRIGVAATPIGRAAVPEDIADSICFLLSDDARYILGHTLDVNGGRVMT